MKPKEIHHKRIDGTIISYTDQTKFYVEIGRRKSAYKIVHVVVGNYELAAKLYNELLIAGGYKKRLRMENETLLRVTRSGRRDA